jgi:hypothetical protein
MKLLREQLTKQTSSSMGKDHADQRHQITGYATVKLARVKKS